MDDVFPAVVFLSVYEGLTDVGSSSEYSQSAPLAVINTRHRLLGVDVNQDHISTGIRHSTLDLHLLVVGQDMVAKRHRRWHKGNIGI